MRKAWLYLFLLGCGCHRIEVTAFRVDRGPVDSTVTSVEAGVVEPLQKASLASPVSGRVVRVLCVEGDTVEAGATLVELENDIERLRVDETKSEFERLRKMKDDVATQEQFERAEFAYRRAKVQLDQTFIRAPFAGVVAEVNARVGEMTFGSMSLALSSGVGGADPLVYLVDNSKLFVEAEIDEWDVARVKIGQKASVTVGGLDRYTIQGRVVSISPVVSTEEGESRTAEVKVELSADRRPAGGNAGDGYPPGAAGSSDEPRVILVGMSADLEILIQRVEETIRIPTAALLERGEERYVYVVADGKLSRRSIKTGLGNWDMTQVLEGLSPGELVVLPTDVKLLTENRDVKAIVAEAREDR